MKDYDEMKTVIYDKLTDDAKHIRQEVFVEEQGFQEEFDAIDKTARHIVLYDDEKAVAVCRVFCQKGNEYHIGRVAVIKTYRGQGLGRVLMTAAEECAKALGGTSMALSGQVRVVPFYEKLGYQTEGPEYLDEGCPHVKLKKKLIEENVNAGAEYL